MLGKFYEREHSNNTRKGKGKGEAMGQVYQLLGSGGRTMVPIETDSLAIGQKALQVHKHKVGVICEKSAYGYTVIFDDGDESTGQTLDSRSPFTMIKTVEGFVGGDEVNRLIQLRDAKRLTDRWDREEAAKQKALEVARLTEQLRAKYPWATGTTSKNIKLELGRAFPGVKFSVKTRGNAIDIYWADGPSTKQAEEITGKYSGGSFDGMTDCYEYDRSAFGEAVSAVLGRANYIFTHRDRSDTLIQKAIDRLADKYNFKNRDGSTGITVERFKAGDLYNASPMEGADSNYWSFQSLIGREIEQIGMMPRQEAQ